MGKTINSRLVGENIRHFRLSKDWTQDYLAEKAGYSTRGLRRIETDGTDSIDVVNRFAEVFDVPALDILS